MENLRKEISDLKTELEKLKLHLMKLEQDHADEVLFKDCFLTTLLSNYANMREFIAFKGLRPQVKHAMKLNI